MAVYKPESVSDQPEVEILQWSVKQLPNGDRHLIGVVPISRYDGRVTSKIMEYADRTITTRSGRRYHLNGPSGGHPNANYVWAAWCRVNSIDPSEAVDVSDDYRISLIENEDSS